MIQRLSSLLLIVALLGVALPVGRVVRTGSTTKGAADARASARVLTDAEQQSTVGGTSGCTSWTTAGWSCGQCCLDLWLVSVCVAGCVPQVLTTLF